jgi:hypothetical protein
MPVEPLSQLGSDGSTFQFGHVGSGTALNTQVYPVVYDQQGKRYTVFPSTSYNLNVEICTLFVPFIG